MPVLAGPITPEPDQRSRNTRGSPAADDPAHALYGHAAGMLAAAQALEAATHASGSVAAAAPTLVCVEASLTALAAATERLRNHALQRLADPVLAVDDLRRQRADIALDLGRLVGVLEQGSQASAQARGSLQPALDELTLV